MSSPLDRNSLAASVPLPLPGVARVPVDEVGGGATAVTAEASDNEVASWAARATDLGPEFASLVMARMVNRIDRWGAYKSTSCIDHQGRERKTGSTFTAPASPGRRHRGNRLGTGRVGVHLRGRQLIGVHSTSANNTCLWGGVDLDLKDEDKMTPGEVARIRAANLTAALAWRDTLHLLGFRTLLEDSNGKGGYHLWVFFCQPVASWVVYAFLEWLTNDYAAHGLAKRPETFPKQRRLSETATLGNWLRIPGRHPKRNHCSRFLDGERWVVGGKAVDHFVDVLRSGGNDPALIPAEVVAAAVAENERHAIEGAAERAERATRRREPRLAAAVNDDVASPGKLTPGHRHDYLRRVAYAMRKEGAGEEDVLDRLKELNELYCDPPKPDSLLEALVRSTFKRIRPDPPDPPAENYATASPPVLSEAAVASTRAAAQDYARRKATAARSIKGKALSVHLAARAWIDSVWADAPRRADTCGYIHDHLFTPVRPVRPVTPVEADKKLHPFIGALPCGAIDCDYCWARIRTRGAPEVLQAILERTPRLGQGVHDPRDPDDPPEALPAFLWRAAQVYTWDGPAEEWETIRKRINRARAKAKARAAPGEQTGHAKIERQDGTLLAVCDEPFLDSTMRDPADAACRFLEAFKVVSRRKGAISRSHSWGVDRVKRFLDEGRLNMTGPGEWLSPAVLKAVAETRFCVYEDIITGLGGTLVPTRRQDDGEPERQAWRGGCHVGYRTPRGWGKAERDQLRGCLRRGAALVDQALQEAIESGVKGAAGIARALAEALSQLPLDELSPLREVGTPAPSRPATAAFDLATVGPSP